MAIMGERFKTEKEYRALEMDSSSSLKDFCLDRRKYYKKWILGEKVEEKDTQAILMGNLVEILLFEPERFDDKFYMSACANAPTGLMNDFIEALYVVRKENVNDEGEVSISMENALKEAYDRSGFKISYESVLKKFVGSDAEIYFNEIETIRKKGLSVVTLNDVQNAEKVVQELKNNFVTSDIVNLETGDRYKVYKQLQVEGYEVGNHKFKSMMDFVIIDTLKKTIQVYDLKVVWSVEGFYEDYYLYRRAYIQAFLYYMAAKHFMLSTPEYVSFSILPPKFIVADSINYFNPLIYTLTEADVEEAYLGFEHKGKQYKGVKQLIVELIFAYSNGTWNMSMDNYLSNGIVKLKK